MTQIRFLENRSYSTREIAEQLCSDFSELDVRYVQSAISTWFNRMQIPSQNGQKMHRLFSGDDCQRCYNHWLEHFSKRFGKVPVESPDVLDVAFEHLSSSFLSDLNETEPESEPETKRDRFNIQITGRPDLKQKITDFRYSKRLGFAKAAILILDTYFEEHPLDTFEDKVSKMSRDELAELVMKNRSAFDDRFYI